MCIMEAAKEASVHTDKWLGRQPPQRQEKNAEGGREGPASAGLRALMASPGSGFLSGFAVSRLSASGFAGFQKVWGSPQDYPISPKPFFEYVGPVSACVQAKQSQGSGRP